MNTTYVVYSLVTDNLYAFPNGKLLWLSAKKIKFMHKKGELVTVVDSFNAFTDNIFSAKENELSPLCLSKQEVCLLIDSEKNVIQKFAEFSKGCIMISLNAKSFNAPRIRYEMAKYQLDYTPSEYDLTEFLRYERQQGRHDGVFDCSSFSFQSLTGFFDMESLNSSRADNQLSLTMKVLESFDCHTIQNFVGVFNSDCTCSTIVFANVPLGWKDANHKLRLQGNLQTFYAERVFKSHNWNVSSNHIQEKAVWKNAKKLYAIVPRKTMKKNDKNHQDNNIAEIVTCIQNRGADWYHIGNSRQRFPVVIDGETKKQFKYMELTPDTDLFLTQSEATLALLYYKQNGYYFDTKSCIGADRHHLLYEGQPIMTSYKSYKDAIYPAGEMTSIRAVWLAVMRLRKAKSRDDALQLFMSQHTSRANDIELFSDIIHEIVYLSSCVSRDIKADKKNTLKLAYEYVCDGISKTELSDIVNYIFSQCA